MDETVTTVYYDIDGNVDEDRTEDDEADHHDDCGCPTCCNNGGNDVLINIAFDVTIDETGEDGPVISMAQVE